MAIARIASITVPVADHERSLDLYRDVLGFTVIRDGQNGDAGRQVHLTAPGGGASIVLVASTGSRPAGSVNGGALQVRDMLEAVERLATGGIDVTITVHRLDTESGVWAEFRDHDGNAWMLWQPAEAPADLLAA